MDCLSSTELLYQVAIYEFIRKRVFQSFACLLQQQLQMIVLPCSKRSLSTDYCNRTYSDFNSRLLLSSAGNELKLRSTFFKNPKPNIEPSTSVIGQVSPGSTSSIRNKLEKMLNKNRRSPPAVDEVVEEPDLHKKITSVFFKSNYRINRNKKQLEQLNKKATAHSFRREHADIKNNPKGSIFIIKQIKPTGLKSEAYRKYYSKKDTLDDQQPPSVYVGAPKTGEHDRTFTNLFKAKTMSTEIPRRPNNQDDRIRRRVIFFDQRILSYDGVHSQEEQEGAGDLTSKSIFNNFKKKPRLNLYPKGPSKEDSFEPWDREIEHMDPFGVQRFS